MTYSACAQQADNTLRFDCTVTTNAPSDVYIQFGKDTTLACESGRVTPTSLNKNTHTITMYGMKPSTTYDWKAHAVPAGGGTAVYGTCGHTATGAVPADAGLSSLIITPDGAADDVHNFLTSYGCDLDPSDPAARDAFIIVDEDGEIIRYQEPLAGMIGMTWTDPNLPPVLEAIGMSRPTKRITGIVNHDIIVEYDLSGNLLHAICRDEGTTYCPGTDYTPDLFFDEDVYVHHDVQIVNNMLFALNAREVEVADAGDCDGDLNFAENQYMILDGVYGFDLAGPTLEVEWDWTDAASMTMDYTARATDPDCLNGYWYTSPSYQLRGSDVLHTNSLWVDVAEQWMLSSKAEHDVFSIDRDEYSGTYNDVIGQIDGDGVDGDWTFGSSPTYPVAFNGQHAAHWGTLGDLVLFDNHSSSSGPTRGVVYSLDDGTMEIDAIEQYTMLDLGPSTIYCPFGGSAWQTLGGNAFLTCPQTSGHAIFNEFDGSDSVIWTVELECDGGASYLPVGSAFCGYANAL